MSEYYDEYDAVEAEAAKKEECMTCPATGYQRVGVSVPVTVTPFAHSGPAQTKCCGRPVITPGERPCPGKKDGKCTFTISQVLCVEIPIVFGATACVGDTYVDCMGVSSHDICDKCHKNHEEDEY